MIFCVFVMDCFDSITVNCTLHYIIIDVSHVILVSIRNVCERGEKSECSVARTTEAKRVSSTVALDQTGSLYMVLRVG